MVPSFAKASEGILLRWWRTAHTDRFAKLDARAGGERSRMVRPARFERATLSFEG